MQDKLITRDNNIMCETCREYDMDSNISGLLPYELVDFPLLLFVMGFYLFYQLQLHATQFTNISVIKPENRLTALSV